MDSKSSQPAASASSSSTASDEQQQQPPIERGTDSASSLALPSGARPGQLNSRARSHTLDEIHAFTQLQSSKDNNKSTISLAQGNTAQLGTLVDLLKASSTDPNHHYDSDSDSEESSGATLSSVGSSANHSDADDDEDQQGDDPHLLQDDHDQASSVRRFPRGRVVPVRGQSMLQDQSENERLIRELALDSMDETSAAIERAQDKASTDESFEDPASEDDGHRSTPEELLARIVDEFGPWTDDSERFVQQVPGALYRGVLIKGLLMLTNRRFLIYAVMPPPTPSDDVIHAGPVTVHLGQGRFHRTRRSWLELRSESVTWYSSSAKRYKPLGACRLSNTRELSPYDRERPKFLDLTLVDGRRRSLEFDTVESAIQWRSDFEAALYSFRTTADKLRLSLPLQKITAPIRIEPYTTIAERVQIFFDPTNPCATGSETSSDTSQDQTVEFGYLKTHTTFAQNLIKYAEEAKTLPPCGGALPILEIDSPERTAETEHLESLQNDSSLAAKFVKTFALGDAPGDLYLNRNVALVRSLPVPGALAISSVSVCFWRKAVIGDVKLRIPLVDIDDVTPAKAFGFRIFGLAIQIHGSPDCRLDFTSKGARDDAIAKIKTAVLTIKASGLSINTNLSRTSTRSIGSPSSPGVAGTPTSRLSNASFGSGASATSSFDVETLAASVKHAPYKMQEAKPMFGVDPEQAVVFGMNLDEKVSLPAGFVPSMPHILGSSGKRRVGGLHFVCLTIGSRGDVQPYVSLGLQLLADGNRVTIASHPEYREWVEGYGIEYKEVGGDPGALMKLSVEHKMFSPGFFKESLGHFRKWLDDLFHESWVACQGADVLIESPSTMAGIHVAEGLGIPYFRAFTMPWTHTSTYPQAFAASVDLGPTYNSLSYSIFDSVMWKAMAGQVNKWRKNELGLKATSEQKMAQRKVPFVYNFSSVVVPRPNDWKDHIFISGYWFLDDQKEWTAPPGLLEFIAKARQEGKSLIYVGFGSIIVPDAAAVTKAVVNAVHNADVRVILSKGWSERGDTKHEEVALPDTIFSVPSIAHDRLFPLIDAACHHGGAGTTGASLRAGLPTLIAPWFGDQYFWAQRVQKLGVGLRVAVTEKDLTHAFKTATTDRVMRQKAQDLGVKIRAENGPRAALSFIYDHIHLAKERADIRAARAAGGAKVMPTAPDYYGPMFKGTPPTTPGTETPPLSPSGTSRSKTCEMVSNILPRKGSGRTSSHERATRSSTLPVITGASPLVDEPMRASTTLGLTEKNKGKH